MHQNKITQQIIK